MKTLVRKVGGSVLGATLFRYVGEGKSVDVRLGMALAGNRRVPVAPKMAALALGFMLTFALEFFELPREAVLAFLLPVVGLGLNFAIDGAELVALPLLFGAALLPYLAPKHLVEQALAERNGPIPVRVNAKR